MSGLKAWAGLLLAAALGCSSGELLPPPVTYDPAAAGLPALPPSTFVSDDAKAEELLAEYAKRFSQGYPLYPADEIKFVVLGQPELTFNARVPVEGHITFPHVGKLVLAGRTLGEVRDELVQRLGGAYLVKPDISVLIQEYSKRSVFVLGAVEHPKDYELPSGRLMTLMQAVSQAGGFKPEAEKRGLLLFRQKTPGALERLTIPVDLVALTRSGQGKDPIVLPDDVIFIPTREKVYVLGQVTNSGGYVVPADHPTTVTQAITMAGGFTRIAKESGTKLMRRMPDGQRAVYVIDVPRILDGHPEGDVPVQPGDVIFVPESFF